MNSPDSFTGPVNLGNPVEFSIFQLAQKVIELTNSGSDIIFAPLPSDDPAQRQPDITLAKKSLDWSPQISLEKGLEKTIAYFSNILTADE